MGQNNSSSLKKKITVPVMMFKNAQTKGPLPRILEALHRVNVRCPVSEPKVLEVFAGDGMAHVVNYMHFFGKNLTCWEIDHEKSRMLMRNVPQANVQLVDSYEQIKRTDFRRGFPGLDIIIIDPVIFGGKEPEYFELFPHIFNWVARPAWFVITVCPDPRKLWEQAEAIYLERMDKEALQHMIWNWDSARQKFYGLPRLDYDTIVTSPDCPLCPPSAFVSLDEIHKAHGELALKHRFRTNYGGWVQRDKALYYYIQEIEKMADSEIIIKGGR